MPQAVNSLTLQLLEWIDAHPRTYRESMEAWRSTCPRLSIWDDAMIDGLIEVQDTGASLDDSPVLLTPAGNRFLNGRAADSDS